MTTARLREQDQSTARNREGRGVTNLQWLRDKQISNIQKYLRKKDEISKLHRSIVEADKEVTTARLRKQDQSTGK